MTASAASPPVLRLARLSKRFGRSRALDDVELTVAPGEVHGLLGENGSGKSTLIKILSGFHAPEDGAEMEVNGKRVELPMHPGQFRELGISFVHQDLSLVDDVSVVENLFLGDLVARRGGVISWRRERRRAEEVLGRYGLSLDPRALVGELPETSRALLAIVRAVEETRHASAASERPVLLVLDEPTVFLPRDGKERLFAIVRGIVERGEASVIFVTHDLDDALALSDRITVLRDGRVQGTVKSAETSERELIHLIVGRRLDLLESHHSGSKHPPEYRVEGLAGGGVREMDFELGRGEIVGFTGLAGSGFEDVPYLLYGALRARAGILAGPDKMVELRELTPPRALERGIVLIPADRKTAGSVPSLSVADNLTLPVLDRFSTSYGRLRLRPLAEYAGRELVDHDVRPRDPSLPYGTLSGGNQQKVMLAKWLQLGPRLMLLHEPTQGVDIGARAQIFDVLREIAREGTAILVASSDYEQLAAVCDRVLVCAGGAVSQQLSGEGVAKERIAEQVYNSTTTEGSQRWSG